MPTPTLLRAPFRLAFDLLLPWQPCRIRILVIADGPLNFEPSLDFGLAQFLDTLRNSRFYGLSPEVRVGHRQLPTQDFPQFRFRNDLSADSCDVLFLFGFDPGEDIEPADQQAIALFMQAGGGVFATGDHGELGAAMGASLPRVRSMRRWRPGVPMTSPLRHTTNLPGDDGVYQFEDQSDHVPQRSYPRYYARPGTPVVSAPHLLLQAPTPNGRYLPIEYQPDHPHEGECIEPRILTEKLLPGSTADEFPLAPGGNRPAPQIIAFTVSYGGAFPPNKQAILEPRLFGSICAYDGRQAGVGRVVTDATWHHFVNINIDGTGTDRTGLRDASGQDLPELSLIRQYWRNLVSWLAPVRLCRALAPVAHVLQAARLGEELLPHFERELATAEGRERAGLQIEAALTAELSPVELESTLSTLVDGVFGKAARNRSEVLGRDLCNCALAAAGALLAAPLRAPGRAKALEAAGFPHAAEPQLAALGTTALREVVTRTNARIENTQREIAQLRRSLN
jgi:hypothetical protein